MSLKAFHVVFIAFATLISAAFGLWALGHPGGGVLWLGLISLALAVALPIYGVWFLRKMKKVSFL